jgi:hypothetical protein
MSDIRGSKARISVLLSSLGVDEASFDRLVEWILAERLVHELAAAVDRDPSFFMRSDALKQFRQLLAARTGRRWETRDYEALFERVHDEVRRHYREPISLEALMVLRAEEPFRCVVCGKRPPEVDIHVDHVVPASKGGSSKRENLQFMCSEHNLKKSNNREVTDPWLLLP